MIKRILSTITIVLMLSGCNTTQPSEKITESALKSITAIEETVTQIEKNIKPECQDDSLLANLNSVKVQISNVAGQIESINLSCIVEKEVLEGKITNRELFIALLFLLIGALIYLLFRKAI